MIKEEIKELCGEFASRAMELYEIPGICLGIFLKGEKLIEAAGRGSLTEGSPIDRETAFRCGSLAKLLTSEAVMRLAEDGKISLSDRAARLLPETDIKGEAWRRTEVIHMLTHTSGMGSSETAGEGMMFSWKPDERRFRYSDTAYDLLGLIVREKTGREFEEYIEEEIFRPLHMECSSFMPEERGTAACGCEKDENKRMKPVECLSWDKKTNPSSGLVSTAGDLLRLSEYFMEEAPYGDLRWKKYADIPGGGSVSEAGWFLKKTAGFCAAGHEGGVRGFRSCLWMCRERKLAVTVLVNISAFPAGKTGLRLLERLCDLQI